MRLIPSLPQIPHFPALPSLYINPVAISTCLQRILNHPPIYIISRIANSSQYQYRCPSRASGIDSNLIPKALPSRLRRPLINHPIHRFATIEFLIEPYKHDSESEGRAYGEECHDAVDAHGDYVSRTFGAC
jgi:hypothetical protein